MSDLFVSHSGPMWRWTASNGVSWHFVTIDGQAGDDMSAIETMRRLELGRKRGFRSLKVEAKIGATTWQTSCFPDTGPSTDDEGWLLPVKAQVRKAEKLAEGSDVALTLRLI
ncbi:MAG: DUF1905 domain-containing protein [Pseudomonadota bacterium]